MSASHIFNRNDHYKISAKEAINLINKFSANLGLPEEMLTPLEIPILYVDILIKKIPENHRYALKN